MSEQKKNEPEIAEADDEVMDEVSGGLPNGSMTTQNGQGTSYDGIFG
jgi:hypothetical protein